MRRPRAFISSTIYGLHFERQAAEQVLATRGFEVLRSERPETFPVNPFASDTYENCLERVKESQIFVMIVGKRVGGNQTMDLEETILYKEFRTALDADLGLPIYIFVDKEVDSLRKAYKNDQSTDKKCFRDLHPKVDPRVFDFISEFANLFGDDGKPRRNLWYFSFGDALEIERILDVQLSFLLDSALRAYSEQSVVSRSPYEFEALRVRREEDTAVLRMALRNRGISEIFDVRVRLYCRFQADLRYYFEIPSRGLSVAPIIQPPSAIREGTWTWAFILKDIEPKLEDRGVPPGLTEKVTRLIHEEVSVIEHEFISAEGTKTSLTSFDRKHISFLAIADFTEVGSGKMRVLREAFELADLRLEDPAET